MHSTQFISALAALLTFAVIANADTTTCVPNRPLAQSDLDEAFTNLRNSASGGVVFINGKEGTGITSNNAAVQFYVCNNAASRRFFTLDSDKQANVDNAYALCGGNAFFITESDDFSYGGDVAGVSECGGF